MLARLGEFNEPYYPHNVHDDLAAHFEAAGRVPETKLLASPVLTFRKLAS